MFKITTHISGGPGEEVAFLLYIAKRLTLGCSFFSICGFRSGEVYIHSGIIIVFIKAVNWNMVNIKMEAPLYDDIKEEEKWRSSLFVDIAVTVAVALIEEVG